MKKLFISITIIIGILIATIIIVPYFFKDKLIELIKQQVNKNINATVNFNNNIGLSLIKNFPNLTLNLEDLSVICRDDFEGDTLISWNNIEATVDLKSIINGEQIIIRKIVLESPNINAKVLANGKTNWDITKSDTSKTTITDTSQTKFNLSLKKLEINNANITYNDKAMGINTHLSGMDYDMTGDFTQEIFELNILSSVKQLDISYGGITYLSKVKSGVKVKLDMNMPEMKYTIKENSISLN
jgi:uncharacterized protein involved in outer membrane biogenesis